jgi:hypothetical protein
MLAVLRLCGSKKWCLNDSQSGMLASRLRRVVAGYIRQLVLYVKLGVLKCQRSSIHYVELCCVVFVTLLCCSKGAGVFSYIFLCRTTHYDEDTQSVRVIAVYPN